MRSLFILALLVGMCILIVGYLKSNLTCSPPVTDFKYVGKTFDEEQSMPRPTLSIFNSMFEGPDPWIQTDNNARPGLT